MLALGSCVSASTPTTLPPSLVPSATPSTASPTALPTSTPSVKSWVGVSGWWGTPHLWFPRGSPLTNDSVVVRGESNSTLALNYSTTVDALTFASSVLDLSAELRVQSAFEFSGGTLQGGGELVLLRGATGVANATSSSELRIVNVTVHVAAGSSIEVRGLLHIGSGANVSIAGTLVARAARILPSVAELGFARQSNAVLNDRLQANLSLPAVDAVDDVIATKSVHPFLRGDFLFGMDVEDEDTARDVYVRAGWPLSGQRATYAVELDINVEACATACERTTWCLSFDHRASMPWCGLSALDAAAAGGLSDRSWSTDPVNHYERRVSSSAIERAAAAGAVISVSRGGLAKFLDSTNVSIPLELHGSLVATTSTIDGGLQADVGSNTTVSSSLTLSGASGNSFDFADDAGVSVAGTLRLENAASVKLPESLEVTAVSLTDSSNIANIGTLDLGVVTLDLSGGSSITASNMSLTARHVAVDAESRLVGSTISIIVLHNFYLRGTVSATGRNKVVTLGDATGADPTGGAGGGHGGFGGGGGGADGDEAAGGAGYGCVWWPVTPGGSGSAAWSSGKRSSKGGGVVAIHVHGSLILDGLVSANGEDGDDSVVGGGGAGGSVIVNATELTGSGRATANGGAGGYPGGWLAGGGGGGGHVLGMIRDSAAFTGLFSAKAGDQATTPLSSNGGGGLAGAGTVLVAHVGNNSNTLLLSLDSGATSPTAMAREAAPIARCPDASIPDLRLAAAARAGIIGSLWLAGGARAAVPSGLAVVLDGGCARFSTIWPGDCGAHISGDGSGRLEVHGGLELPSIATMQHANVLINISSATVRGADELNVTGDSAGVELSGDGTFDATATWRFLDGATLAQIDDGHTALALARLDMTAARLTVARNMSINASVFRILSGSHVSGIDTSSSLTLASTTFVNSSRISRLQVSVTSAANATLVSAKLALGATLRNLGRVHMLSECGSIDADARGASNSSTSKIVNAGTLECSGDGTVLVSPRLENFGTFVVNTHVSLSGGGSQETPGVTRVRPDATLSIDGCGDCTFEFGSTTYLTGGGTLLTRSKVISPLTVEARPAGVALAIVDGGRLEATTEGSLLGELHISGGVFLAARAVHLQNVTMSGGTLRVSQGVTVNATSLTLGGGTIRFESPSSSLTTSTMLWAIGDASGPGSLRVLTRLDFAGDTAAGASSHDDGASCPRLLDRVVVTVLDVAEWSRGVVVVSQAAKMIIGHSATLNIVNESTRSNRLITPGGLLYSYSRTRFAALDAWPAPIELVNTTPAACASACQRDDGRIELARAHSVAARAVTAMDFSLKCRGFDYERFERRCRLHVEDGTSSDELTTANPRWDHYRLVSDWASPPKVVLHVNASMKVAAQSFIDVHLMSANSSLVRLHPEAHLGVRGGGRIEGGIDVGFAGLLEVGLPDYETSTSVSSPPGLVLSPQGASRVEGANGSKLAFTGGGPHVLPLDLDSPLLSLTAADGAYVEIPSTVRLLAANLSNASVLHVGARGRIWAASDIKVADARIEFEAGGSLASKRLHVAAGGRVSSSTTLDLAGSAGQLQLTVDGVVDVSDTLNVSDLCALLRVGSIGEVSAARVFADCGNVSVDGVLHADGRGGEAGDATKLGSANAAITPGSPHGGGGGGGGHGGNGAPGASGARGGSAFGAADNPNIEQGGGGGAPAQGGGNGGGVVSLSATTHIIIDGHVSARGADGVADYGGGGGAGGSIVLQVASGSWTGVGAVTVAGGRGRRAPQNWVAGGGGAGGRIFASFARGLFAGTISTAGGSGFDMSSGWGWFDGELSCSIATCRENTIEDRRIRAAGGTLYVEYHGNSTARGDATALSTLIAAGRYAAPWRTTMTGVVVDNGGHSPRTGLSASIGVLAQGSLDALLVRGFSRVLADQGGPLAVGTIVGDGTSELVIPNASTLVNTTSNELVVAAVTVEAAAGGILGSTPAMVLYIKENATVALGAGSGCGGRLAKCALDAVTIEGTLRLVGSVNTDATTRDRLAPALYASTNVTISATGWLDADGAGHFGGYKGGTMHNASFGDAVGSSGGAYGPAGGGGGGHGGSGGVGLGARGGPANLESVVAAPMALGGGGGASFEGDGGRGGGRVRVVTNALFLEGRVTAHGDDGVAGAGGGAGGSVWISVNSSCNGSGVVSVAGGRGSRSAVAWGGSGGGGRIALSCPASSWPFTLRLVAHGGGHPVLSSSPNARGAFPSQSSELAVDFASNDKFEAAGSGTVLVALSTSNTSTYYLSVGGNACNNNATIVASSAIQQLGDASDLEEFAIDCPANVVLDAIPYPLRVRALRSTGNATLSLNASVLVLDANVIPSGLELFSGDGELRGRAFTTAELTVLGTLSLTPTAKTTVAAELGNYTFDGGLRVQGEVRVTAGSNTTSLMVEHLVVESGGRVVADGYGGAGAANAATVGGGSAPGSNLVTPSQLRSGPPRGAGGSHAGAGGGDYPCGSKIAGYGSALRPAEGGSGGGASERGAGGAGGGAIYVRVAGDCTLNGSVSARGLDAMNGGGGGAGGSIWLQIDGALILGDEGGVDVQGGKALGGLEEFGGGGGSGGRAAIYAGSSAANAESLTKLVRAHSGWQSDEALNPPAPGTALVSIAGIATLYIADASDGVAACSRSTAQLSETATLHEIRLTNGAALAVSEDVNLTHVSGNGTLSITDGAMLAYFGTSLRSGLRLEVSDDASLEAKQLARVDQGAFLAVLTGGILSIETDMLVAGTLEVSAEGGTTSSGRYKFHSLNVTGQVYVSSRNVTSSADDGSVILEVTKGSLVVARGGSIDGGGGGPLGGTRGDGEGGTRGGSAGGGGGGHGGRGGFSELSASGGAAGGNAFGPIGGGGGGGVGVRGEVGGAGGAGLKIILQRGDAVIEGNVAVHGADAMHGGAGAGGSIWITASSGRLRGSGRISADGGSTIAGIVNASDDGSCGAGAGGRVAIDVASSLFTGTFSAVGGRQYAARPRAALESTRVGRATDNLMSTFIDKETEGVYAPSFDVHRSATVHPRLVEAAPGTIALRTSSDAQDWWDWLRVEGSNGTTIATASTVAGDAFMVKQVEVGPGVAVSTSLNATVANVTGYGTLDFVGSWVRALHGVLQVASNVTLRLRDGTTVTDSPALIVEEGATLDVGDETVALAKAYVGGTIVGSVVHLDVAGDLTVDGRISADGRGDEGSEPGFDGNGIGRGASSGLGGSGGGHGGAGIAGLGAVYLERVANAALNRVENASDVLNRESAQFLVDQFPSGVPNASLATGELLSAAVWGGADYLVRSAAAVADEGGDATGDASYVGSLGGGRIISASSGGKVHGDAYGPTSRGGGGGSAHAPLGHGGHGGGVVRLRARLVNISGVVSADGEDGGEGGGGGGAGGSIWFEACEAVVGDGLVSASGGLGQNKPTDYDDSVGWVARAPGGGGGGGGRVALAQSCSAYDWAGTVRAASGVSSTSSLALDSHYLGTVAWLNRSLTRNASIQTAGVDGTLAVGDSVDVVATVGRRGPVQIITADGTGNGTLDAATESGAVVRGTWRVRYRYSAWSASLATQATALQVHAALAALSPLKTSSIAVDRNPNSRGTAWAWSVTFFDEPEETTAKPLLVLDATRIYSTDGNASMTVERAVDPGVASVAAPAEYASAASVIRGDVALLGSDVVARWISPSTMRVTILNASGAAPPGMVRNGSLSFGLNATVANASGRWLPAPASIDDTVAAAFDSS